MRPQAVSADAPELRLPDLEIERPFFNDDSPSGIVAPLLVAGSRILHQNVPDPDCRTAARDHGEAGNRRELHFGNSNAIDAIEQDSVVRVENAERVLRRSHLHRLIELRAISVDRKIAKPNRTRILSYKDCASLEFLRRFEERPRTRNFQIVSARRQPQFGGDFNHSRRQLNHAGGLRRESLAQTRLRSASTTGANKVKYGYAKSIISAFKH